MGMVVRRMDLTTPTTEDMLAQVDNTTEVMDTISRDTMDLMDTINIMVSTTDSTTDSTTTTTTTTTDSTMDSTMDSTDSKPKAGKYTSTRSTESLNPLGDS